MENITYQDSSFFLANPYQVRKSNLEPLNPQTKYSIGINIFLNPFLGAFESTRNNLANAVHRLETGEFQTELLFDAEAFNATLSIMYYAINYGVINSNTARLDILIDDHTSIPLIPNRINRGHDKGYIDGTYAEEFIEDFECQLLVKDLKKVCNSQKSLLRIINAQREFVIDLDANFKRDVSILVNLALDSSFREDAILGVDISDENEPCFVYVMQDETNNYYKIGVSKKPEWREKTLQSEKPTIVLIAAKKFVTRRMATSFEKALHQSYSDKRIRGEWFRLDNSEVKEIEATLND